MVLEDSDVEMIEAEIEVSVSRRLQCRVDFMGFVGLGGGPASSLSRVDSSLEWKEKTFG